MGVTNIKKKKKLNYQKIDFRKVRTKIWADRYMYLMTLPVIIYFLIFKYWPMGWLRIAFYDFKILRGIEGSKFVGLKYFKTFLDNPDFLKIMWNTLYLNILNLLFVFTAPILFALLLNEIFKNRFKKVIQTVSYLPHFLSMVVVTSMITTFLSPSIGIVNAVIKKLGYETIHFLGRPGYFRGIMIVSGIWQGMGWGSILYLSALAGIDMEQYEAAVIDGANRFQQILFVTLPGIANTIMIMLILQIGNLLSVGFEKVYLLQNAQNISVSEVLSTYVYKMGIQSSNYSLATAVGLFNAVISLILVLGANRLSAKYSETSLI
ncbi:MAG: sugar ABC transporter permease [Epulopiscium sp.]|nr:sugar ABC transporter permease [Candidatus Epulonipiscium sp.]